MKHTSHFWSSPVQSVSKSQRLGSESDRSLKRRKFLKDTVIRDMSSSVHTRGEDEMDDLTNEHACVMDFGLAADQDEGEMPPEDFVIHF